MRRIPSGQAPIVVDAIESADAADLPTGQWVTVTGTVRDSGGALQVQATAIEAIDEPDDPYEF